MTGSNQIDLDDDSRSQDNENNVSYSMVKSPNHLAYHCHNTSATVHGETQLDSIHYSPLVSRYSPTWDFIACNFYDSFHWFSSYINLSNTTIVVKVLNLPSNCHHIFHLQYQTQKNTCLTAFPHTDKRVENTSHSRILLTNVDVFGNVVTILSLIYVTWFGKTYTNGYPFNGLKAFSIRLVSVKTVSKGV